MRAREEGTDTFRSLRIRNFRLFFIGQLISQTGNWLTMIAQTLLVLRLTDSGVALGILAAAQFGPVLLFATVGGLLADRSDKRQLLFRVQAFAMVQSVVLGIVALADRPPVWVVYLVALAGGFGTAVDNPTRRSFVVELVPRDAINNAASLNTALMTCARVVGPAIGGILVTTVGFTWTFWIDALTYLAVLEGIRRMDPAAITRSEPTPRAKGQIREGLRYAWGHRELRVAFVMMALVGTLGFNFPTVLPLFATRDLGGSELTFTALMSVLSLGSLLAAIVAARRTEITLRTITVASFAFFAALGLMGVAPNPWIAFPVGVAMGFTSVLFMTAGTSMIQITADPAMRGRVMSLQSTVFIGSTPVGGIVVGTISEQLGARWGLAVGAAACLVAAGFGAAAGRRADQATIAAPGA